MKEQLLSWAQSPIFDNKWDRLAFTKKSTFVIAWIYLNEGKYSASVLNLTGEGNRVFEKKNLSSLDEAMTFANTELKKQGYKA